MSTKVPKASYGHLITLSGKGMYLHTVMMTLNQILIYDVCRFLGTGLVTVTHYNDWSPKRRLYDPAFTKRSE